MLLALLALAPLLLGPERPVAEPRPGFATADRVDVASDGNGFMVAWESVGTIYVQPLDAAGKPATPKGIAVASGPAQLAGITSDGHGYIVAFSTTNAVLTAHIDSSGTVSNVVQIAFVANADTSESRAAIASNGDGYLVAWHAGSGGSAAQLLQSDGSPTGPRYRVETQFVAAVSVATNGHDYLVSTVLRNFQGAVVARSATRIGPSGATFPVHQPANGTMDPRTFIQWDGEHYVILWRDGSDVLAVAADDAGNDLGQPAPVAHDVVPVDLEGGLLLARNAAEELVSIRIGADPQPLGIRASRGAAITSSRDGAVYLAASDANLTGALLPAELRPIASAAAAQERPQIQQDTIFWIEASTLLAVAQQGGVPIAVADHVLRNYVVAGDGSRLLVAWEDSSTIRARLILQDRSLSDPIDVADGKLTGAAWTGTQFVVTWEEVIDKASRARFALVGPDGAGAPQFVVPPLPFYSESGPIPLATPAGFVVAYTRAKTVAGTQHSVGIAAFGPDGAPLDSSADLFLRKQLVSAAVDDHGHILLGAQNEDIGGFGVAALDARGNLASPFHSLPRRGSLAWIGDSFLLFSDTAASRLAADGTLLPGFEGVRGDIAITDGSESIAAAGPGVVVFTRGGVLTMRGINEQDARKRRAAR